MTRTSVENRPHQGATVGLATRSAASSWAPCLPSPQPGPDRRGPCPRQRPTRTLHSPQTRAPSYEGGAGNEIAMERFWDRPLEREIRRCQEQFSWPRVRGRPGVLKVEVNPSARPSSPSSSNNCMRPFA